MYEERVDLRGMLRRMVGHPKKDIDAYNKRDALKILMHTVLLYSLFMVERTGKLVFIKHMI